MNDLFDNKDAVDDIKMWLSVKPSQIIDAQNYYNEIKKEFPNHNIILAGHSLGGSLAQILGSQCGEETVTFNAYGTANIINYQIKNSANITNYGNVNDFVFSYNINNQIGNTYTIADNNIKDAYSYLVESNANKKELLKYHFIQNMGDLSKAVKYQGEFRPTEEHMKIKAGIEKTIDYKDIDPDRILTEEEIAKMSDEEFFENEEYINKQINDGKIMSKVQADNQVQSGNLVWVDDYVRDDGTQVSGYYRRKAFIY